MIDLSYLTEEEQEMILVVLKRDTELKNLEEERIKQLRKTEKDRSRLKYLTGDWFYESKYHRHRDRLHGSDIIRTSMRQRKPVSILELSQRWAERPSCVNSEKKDVFIPPEQTGLIEEPSAQPQNDRVDELPGAQQERQRPEVKPRQNPFNSVRSQKDKDMRISDVTPTEEPLLVAESSIPHNAILNTDNTETYLASQCTVKPVPKKRLLLYSTKDSPLDTTSGDLGVKQVMTPAPRSILKPLGSSCNSTGSLRLHIPPDNDDSSCGQSSATISPVSLEMPISPPLSPCSTHSASEWLERRQVRFSSMVRSIESEQGEHSVLDEDLRPLADEDVEWDRSGFINNDHHEPQSTQVSNFHITADVAGKAIQLGTECQTQKVTVEEGRLISKVLEWFGRGSLRNGTPVQRDKNKEETKDHETLDARSEDLAPLVVHPKTKPSPKPRRGLFALFSRTDKKDKSLEVLVSDIEVTSQDTKASSTSECQEPCTLIHEAHDNVFLQDESKMTEILQVTSEAEDGNIPVCKKEAEMQESDKCPVNENYYNALDRRLLDSGIRPFISKPSDPVESIMGEMSALSLNEDGKPDLDSRKISEGSINKLQTDMHETDVSMVSPSSLLKHKDDAPGSEFQEHALVESLSKDICDLKKEISAFKMSFSEQENKVSINDLRSFWEKEKNGLRVIVGSPACPPNTKDSSLESSIELSNSQPDIRLDTPDLTSSLDRISLSLDKDVGPGPSRVPEQDHQDVKGRVPYTAQNTSNYKPQSCPPFPKHGKTLEEGTDMRPIMPKERKLSTDSQSNARLARSCIPLSLKQYLGIHKQTVLDERERLEHGEAGAGEVSKQGNQGKVSHEGSPSRHSQTDSEEFTFDSSGSSTPEAWSFSHTSSACESEEDSPVKAALERANARPVSISRSLEDLVSDPSLSTVNPNTETCFSDPEQMKMMSMSVPAFIHQEMDYRNSDCTSESSFSFDRLRSCNASSTFSVCSEAVSMSSVTASVMSIYSSDLCNVEIKGTVQFAINYMRKLGEFQIFVVQCKDLAVADSKKNRSDPYVKCYLLPDKAKYGKRKTCVRKKTLDPTYNEILRFKIPMGTLKTQKLNLSVWHNDTFHHNSFLGEVEIDLAEWDFTNTQTNDYLLKGRAQVPPSPKHSVCSEELRAEMRVALRFLPQTSHSNKNKVNGEVQIWVKECKNLPISRGVSVDPFVKCTILPDSSRKGRQKTRVLKRTSSPEFNHTMVYDGFRPEDLKEACVELTVWGHDRLHNHFIGGIRLGPGTGKSYGADVDWMDSNSTEAALWERMMQSHNEWVEGVLPLRMLVMARISK